MPYPLPQKKVRHPTLRVLKIVTIFKNIMSFCLTACASQYAVPIPQTPCTVEVKEDCIARLIFFRCDSGALPTGSESVIATWLDTLITQGKVFTTGLLRNVEFADPTTQTIVNNDCTPDEDKITGRVFTAEDVNDYRTEADGTAHQFLSFDMYKAVKQGIWNYGVIMCSGNIVLGVKEQVANNTSTNYNGIVDQGKLLQATPLIFTTQEKLENKICRVIHKLSIKFVGDPYSFNRPILNINNLAVGTYTSIDTIRV